MRLTEKGEKACAYPGCRAAVNEDDHCSGCDYYVCEVHSPNAGVMGRHDVVEHWAEEDED